MRQNVYFKARAVYFIHGPPPVFSSQVLADVLEHASSSQSAQYVLSAGSSKPARVSDNIPGPRLKDTLVRF